MKRVSRLYRSYLVLFFVCSGFSYEAFSQRIVDHNAVGWYVYNGDHKIHDQWSIHTEYQWRRVAFLRHWQQSLARIGVSYHLNEDVQVGVGYTNLLTYPYGDHPSAENGFPMIEHRIHEEIQWNDTKGKWSLGHRIRLDQRFQGEPDEQNHKTWDFLNRIRYQLEIQFPLEGTTVDNQEFYLTAFDELFLNLGKDDNVYNQNRILAGIGYQFSDHFQCEIGYLHQITRQSDPDPATALPIYEINRGVRLNVVYNLDFRKNP